MKEMFIFKHMWAVTLTIVLGWIILPIVIFTQYRPDLWAWSFLMYFLIAGGGLGLGFHRMAIHQSVKTFKIFEYVFSFLGMLGHSGSTITWGMSHFMHHNHADKEKDPHSPRYLKWRILLGWLDMKKFEATRKESMIMSKRLLRDPIHMNFHKYYYLYYFGWHLLCYLVGGFAGWLFFAVIPSSWACIALNFGNYFNHKAGYQNFNLDDDSTCTWWLLPFMFGENWHNNHHEYPNHSSFRVKWWEIDLIYLLLVKPLEFIGKYGKMPN